MKSFSISIQADTSGAVENIEKLSKSLADPQNALKTIPVLAKQASSALISMNNGKEVSDTGANALKDLPTVLQMVKDGATIASGEMKGLEKALTGAAQAQELLSKASGNSSDAFKSVYNNAKEWLSQYNELVAKMQAQNVKDDAAQTAKSKATAAYSHSVEMFGSGSNDPEAMFAGTSLYASGLNKEIKTLEASLKRLYETGSKNTSEAEQVKQRITQLSTEAKKTGNSFGVLTSRMKANIIAFSTTMVYGKLLHGLLSSLPKFIMSCAQAASDAAEANNLYMQTFDKMPEKAVEASRQIQESFALAESTANNAIGTFAQYMVGLGKTQGQALEFSQRATQVFLDIRSFKNIGGDLNTFMQKAMSGLAGNTENFRTMGLAISATTAQERLMKKGLGDLTGEAKKAALAQEYLEMVIEQSADALGDFQRNYYSTQNVTQRMSEQWKEYKETMGKGVNSWLTPMKGLIADMLELANATDKAAAAAAKYSKTRQPEKTAVDMGEKIRASWSGAYGQASYDVLQEYRQGYNGWAKSGDAESPFFQTYGTQASRNLESARRSLQALTDTLGVTAEEIVTVMGLERSYTDEIFNVAKAIDEQNAKLKEEQERLDSYARALQDATSIGNSIAEQMGAVGDGWQGSLTAYQRNTGDYDQASIMKAFRETLVKTYNEIASSLALARSGLAGTDEGTDAYNEYQKQIEVATSSMSDLEGQIKDLDKQVADLGKETEKLADKLEKVDVRGLLGGGWQGALSAYQRGTGDYSKASVLEAYKDSLVDAYNKVSGNRDAIYKQMGNYDENSAEYRNLANQANQAGISLGKLAEAIGGVEDTLLELGKPELRQDIDSFTSSLRSDLKRNRYADSLGDSVYKDALLEKYDSTLQLDSLLDTIRETGAFTEEEIASLKESALGAINETYAYQRMKVDESERERLALEAEEISKAFEDEMSDAVREVFKVNRSRAGMGDSSVFASAEQQYKEALEEISAQSLQWTQKYGMARARELAAMKKQTAYREFMNSKLETLTELDWKTLQSVIEDITENPEIREAARQQQLSSLGGYAASEGVGLLNSAFGSVATGAAEGAAAGGPWGAIIGAAVALLEQTEAIETIGSVVDDIVGVLNEFLKPALPLIKAINTFTTRVLASALKTFYEPFKAALQCVALISACVATTRDVAKAIGQTIVGCTKNVIQVIKNVKHNANPLNWFGNMRSLSSGTEDISEYWDDAISNIKSTWSEYNEINEYIKKIQFDTSEIADNTEDNDKLEAWLDMMHSGLITGAEFSALSRNYNGVGYNLGSTGYDSSHYSSLVGSSRQVSIGQVTITVQGSGDPDAVARSVVKILRNNAVYGESA